MSSMLSSVLCAATGPFLCILERRIGLFPRGERSMCVLPDWGTITRLAITFSSLVIVLTISRSAWSGRTQVVLRGENLQRCTLHTNWGPFVHLAWTFVRNRWAGVPNLWAEFPCFGIPLVNLSSYLSQGRLQTLILSKPLFINAQWDCTDMELWHQPECSPHSIIQTLFWNDWLVN